MAHVVVVGAGISGLSVVRSLREALGVQATITLVADRGDFQFVPSNPLVAVGQREPAELCRALEALCAGWAIDLKVNALQRVEPPFRRLLLADGERLSYDFLILATGAEPAWDQIDGLGVDGMPCRSVLSLDQARLAGESYADLLAAPGEIVLAASPGASILGPMYELAFLIDIDLRRRGMRRRVDIKVVTPEPWVGHLGLESDDLRRPLEKALTNQGIAWVANAEVRAVTTNRLTFLDHNRGAKEQGLPWRLCFMWPAFRGIAALRGNAALRTDDGLLPTNAFLQHPAHSNIFAVGQSRVRPRTLQTPVAVGEPTSVYAIHQEAGAVADNISRAIAGHALREVTVEHARWLADMGPRGATFLAAPQVPFHDVNWLDSGRWVPEAKLPFERHFLDGLEIGRSAPALVASFVRQRCREAADLATAHTEGVPRDLTLHLPERQRLELYALAELLRLPPSKLVEKFVTLGMIEARGALDDEKRQALDHAWRHKLVTQLTEEARRVEFDAGAP